MRWVSYLARPPSLLVASRYDTRRGSYGLMGFGLHRTLRYLGKFARGHCTVLWCNSIYLQSDWPWRFAHDDPFDSISTCRLNLPLRSILTGAPPQRTFHAFWSFLRASRLTRPFTRDSTGRWRDAPGSLARYITRDHRIQLSRPRPRIVCPDWLADTPDF